MNISKVDIKFKKVLCVMDIEDVTLKEGNYYYGFSDVGGSSYTVCENTNLNEDGKLDTLVGSFPKSYFKVIEDAKVVTFKLGDKDQKFIPYIKEMEDCVLYE